LCDLLNNTREGSVEDNDYSGSSDGWLNTDQSDSDFDSTYTCSKSVCDTEVEEIGVGGWTATGKERPGFPFTAYSDVQVSMNAIQIVRKYFDLFTGND
jgi:hypothetical protein